MLLCNAVQARVDDGDWKGWINLQGCPVWTDSWCFGPGSWLQALL